MNKKYFGVLGLGVSGIATVKFMLKKGYNFIVWDDSSESIKQCEKTLKISKKALNVCNPDDKAWTKIDYLIASPGIPNLQSHKILKNLGKGTKVICDIELFYMHFPKQKYIAITGTNGKSTTTKLIEHILTCNGQIATVCGNIGTPILSVTPDKNEIIVLEISSYQLDLIETFRPKVAVILNITPDHLDRHGSMEEYIKSKKRIFLNQTSDEYLILNVDDQVLFKTYNFLLQKNKVNLIPTSSEKILFKGISMPGNFIYDNVHKTKVHFPRNKNLRGKHNRENIANAYAATSILTNLFKTRLYHAIKTYSGFIHRLQFLGMIRNIEFINDSKATNAEATKKALNSLKSEGNIFWIGGGLPKKNGISLIKESLKAISYAFLIGKAQDEFAKVLDEINVPYKLSNTLDVAFKDAMNVIGMTKTKGTKILLLSPACASFDQWTNFEKRGERFIQLVQEQLKQ